MKGRDLRVSCAQLSYHSSPKLKLGEHGCDFTFFFLPLLWVEAVQDVSDDAGTDHGAVGSSGE